MRLNAFLLLCCLSAGAYATETLRHATAPEPAPDKKEKSAPKEEENLAPGPEDEAQVTITKKADQTVEEFRVGGKLYMIKITPKHGHPYYLIDDRGDGRFARQDGLDSGVRVPQWVIKKF
jgi:hypothetical protein